MIKRAVPIFVLVLTLGIPGTTSVYAVTEAECNSLHPNRTTDTTERNAWLSCVAIANANTPTETAPTPTLTPQQMCENQYPNREDDPVQKVGYQVCVQDAGRNSGNTPTPQLVGFNRDGVFGCAGIGRYGSVGSAHAGGTYVPVSESAISLNTHILVNKECVLDGLAAEQRKAVMAGLARAGVQALNRGRGGEPIYSTDSKKDLTTARRKIAERILSGPELDSICEPYRDSVKKSLAQNFYRDTETPEKSFSCSFPGSNADLKRMLNGTVTSYDQLYALSYQKNNWLGSYLQAEDFLHRAVDAEQQQLLRELSYGQGFHSTKKCEQVPIGNGRFEEQCFIITPGKVSADLATYFSQVGLNQTAQADEISELIEPLAANISTQVLSSFGGFSGLTESRNGNPSYLDSSAQNAFANAQLETTNAGVQILTKSLQLEQTYVATRTTSKTALEGAANQIIEKEKSCYDKLIAQAKIDVKKELEERVCGAQASDPNSFNQGSSCGVTANIVTKTLADPESTASNPRSFTVIDAKAGNDRLIVTLSKNVERSKSFIQSNVSSMLDVITTSLAAGNRALTILQQLQQTVQGSSNATMTRFALEQLDQLAVARAIHTDIQVNDAKEQNQKIVDVMNKTVEDTIASWDAGWCKAENWRGIVVPTPTSYTPQP